MFIIENSLLAMCVIILIGTVLGSIKLKGISLGTSGILLVALVFGHYGVHIPKELSDFGLILFVYAVGLQAGPKFFSIFRRNGIQLMSLALMLTGLGFIFTLLLAYYLHIPTDLATGMFAGSITNTPALAAAIDFIAQTGGGNASNISAGYGIAYPFSMIGITLLIQFLPRILKTNIKKEDETWSTKQELLYPRLTVKHYQVTNPNCFGKTLESINPHAIVPVNVSRIHRDGEVLAAHTDMVLQKDDIVTVVGKETDLKQMELIFGHESKASIDDTHVINADIELFSPKLANKTLRSLMIYEKYHVVVTRIRRQELEIAPDGNITLETGDILKVVGEREDIEAFTKKFGVIDAHAHETNFIPYFIGLVLGLALGSIPFHFLGISIKLGLAGGVFIISLIISRIKRMGSLSVYVPRAAINLSRELGLMIFLSGAGTSAGAHFVQVLQQNGISIFLSGMFITTASVCISMIIIVFVAKMNTASLAGALSAMMTNPPAFASARKLSKTDQPTTVYASIYPIALIVKVIAIQLLLQVLQFIR